MLTIPDLDDQITKGEVNFVTEQVSFEDGEGLLGLRTGGVPDSVDGIALKLTMTRQGAESISLLAIHSHNQDMVPVVTAQSLDDLRDLVRGIIEVASRTIVNENMPEKRFIAHPHTQDAAPDKQGQSSLSDVLIERVGDILSIRFGTSKYNRFPHVRAAVDGKVGDGFRFSRDLSSRLASVTTARAVTAQAFRVTDVAAGEETDQQTLPASIVQQPVAQLMLVERCYDISPGSPEKQINPG
jgi:hypothetical protein